MKHFSFFLVFSVLFVVAGCGQKNPDGRIDVRGTITLNGKPIPVAGGIFFDPVSGIQGDGGNSQIIDSKIYLTGQAAPKPGKYIVRVYVVDYYDTKTHKPRTADTVDEYAVKVIPDDFNVKSKIEFEVVKGKKNVFNYDIVAPNFKPVRIN